jgi:hypothetical protein
VGVNHCGRDIFVPEQSLHGSDIVAVLKQMCGKGVPESMAAGSFCNGCLPNGKFDRILEVLFQDMMPAAFA